MRILFYLLDKYPPFRVDVAVLIFKRAIGCGYQVDCVLQAEEKQSGFATHRSKHLNVYVGPATARRTLISRAFNKAFSIVNDLVSVRLLLRRSYDAILVKDKFVSAIPLLFLAALFRIPFVYWLSYPFPEDALHRARTDVARYPWLAKLKGGLSYLLLYKLILPACRHAFVQTDEMKRRIQQKGIPTDKMTVLPMGCEIDHVPYVGSVRKGITPSQGFKLGYLGSLSKVRRVDFLLRVLGRVLMRMEDVTLYLIGAGDEADDEKMLLESAEALGVADHVVLTGFVPQAQAWETMRDMDVCLSHLYPDPVYEVGFPTKLIEYMALGKPVVANTHVEQMAILTASKAGLCVPYEEQAFADAVIYLLQNTSLLEPLGRNGRQHVETYYDYHTIADIFHQALQAHC